jgi:hypothetical protein
MVVRKLPHELFSSDDGRNPKEESNKARRERTNVFLESNAASLQVDTPVVTEKAATAVTTSAATEYAELFQRTGKMIQE